MACMKSIVFQDKLHDPSQKHKHLKILFISIALFPSISQLQTFPACEMFCLHIANSLYYLFFSDLLNTLLTLQLPAYCVACCLNVASLKMDLLFILFF